MVLHGFAFAFTPPVPPALTALLAGSPHISGLNEGACGEELVPTPVVVLLLALLVVVVFASPDLGIPAVGKPPPLPPPPTPTQGFPLEYMEAEI